jgi:hypothetical protein
MKIIFKISGLLIAIFFFSSCSKNNISDSTFQQERLIKLSAELEQNYSSASVSSNSSIEEVNAAMVNTTSLNEEMPSVGIKKSVKTNPLKTFNAIKNVKKIIKGYKKNNPEEINNTKEKNKLNLSQNMKTGLILIIIGLLLSALLGFNYIFGVLGSILIVVGLIFILIELLDL